MPGNNYTISETLDIHDYRELGGDAVISLSSAKPGNGVEQIRDGSLETYWQDLTILFLF